MKKDTLESYLARFGKVHNVIDLSLNRAYGEHMLHNLAGSRNLSARYSRKDMRIFLAGFEAGIEEFRRAAMPSSAE